MKTLRLPVTPVVPQTIMWQEQLCFTKWKKYRTQIIFLINPPYWKFPPDSSNALLIFIFTVRRFGLSLSPGFCQYFNVNSGQGKLGAASPLIHHPDQNWHFHGIAPTLPFGFLISFGLPQELAAWIINWTLFYALYCIPCFPFHSSWFHAKHEIS